MEGRDGMTGGKGNCGWDVKYINLINKRSLNFFKKKNLATMNS